MPAFDQFIFYCRGLEFMVVEISVYFIPSHPGSDKFCLSLTVPNNKCQPTSWDVKVDRSIKQSRGVCNSLV